MRSTCLLGQRLEEGLPRHRGWALVPELRLTQLAHPVHAGNRLAYRGLGQRGASGGKMAATAPCTVPFCGLRPRGSRRVVAGMALALQSARYT